MIQTKSLSNRQIRGLLRKSIRGDTRAFQTIVESYQSYAYALAYRILVQQEDAEDVVQEAFLRVWRHAADYHPGTRFTTWLYSIVSNLCYDRLRKRRRQNEAAQAGEPGELPAASPVDHESGDLLDDIHRALSDLPIRQRIVFILRDLQDLPIRVTAEILDISESAVKSNLYYARKQLRTLLKDIQK
jgi:RNA polymerase sigma-70 factor (ECF subfamily)